MIKLVYCITKKPELSQQEFSRYWKEVHGPLGARIPGLRKLVQSHVLPVDGMRPPDFDGMAEPDSNCKLCLHGEPFGKGEDL